MIKAQTKEEAEQVAERIIQQKIKNGYSRPD
jgi:hypothetical protein